MFDKIGRFIEHFLNSAQMKIFLHGCFCLFGSYERDISHSANYMVSSFSCSLGVPVWGVIIGGLWETGNHGAFSNGKVINAFCKIVSCCGLDTISPMTVVNLVEIHFKNFIFRKHQLQTNRQNRFFDFSWESFFSRQKHSFGQLLSYCAAAFDYIACFQVSYKCSKYSLRVNSEMVVKI